MADVFDHPNLIGPNLWRALEDFENRHFPSDIQILIACTLNRLLTENGLIDPNVQFLPDLSLGFELYINSLKSILDQPNHAKFDSSSKDPIKKDNILCDLEKLSASADESIFKLGSEVVDILSDLSDLIPAWMSENRAQELCGLLWAFVVELKILSELLGTDRSECLENLSAKLYADYVQTKISSETIAEFNNLIPPILENLSKSQEIGMLRLLEMAIVPVRRWLAATRGEVGFIKQAFSDRDHVDDPTMSLLFPPEISELFYNISNFVEKHLNLSKRNYRIEPRDKVFTLKSSLRDLLNILGKEAPLGEKKLALAANYFANKVLGQDLKTFYEWTAYKRDDANNIVIDRIELPSVLQFILSDELISNKLAPTEDYILISSGWILESSDQAKQGTAVYARVKTDQSFATKLLSVILDNYSIKYSSRTYAVTLGKKPVKGVAHWILDQYGIMIVHPHAGRLIDLIEGQISQGDLKGVSLLKAERATAVNGFVTRKLTVRFVGEHSMEEDQNNSRRIGKARKKKIPESPPPIIIEIQFRTPHENEAAKNDPQLAHDVYKKRIKDRLNELKSAHPVIDFIADLIQWVIDGAEGDIPSKRGYSGRWGD